MPPTASVRARTTTTSSLSKGRVKYKDSKARSVSPAPGTKIVLKGENDGCKRSGHEPATASGSGIGEAVVDEYEFGGPVGATVIIIWSHYILLYFWYCLETNDGFLVLPTSLADACAHALAFASLLGRSWPAPTVVCAYTAFFAAQLVLAAVVPGVTVDGLPTAPHGKRLKYHCNGYLCYYICIAGVVAVDCAHRAFGVGVPITHWCDNYGQYLLTSIFIADATSIFWYIYGLSAASDDPNCETMDWGSGADREGNVGHVAVLYRGAELSGRGSVRRASWVYDFFMGTCLYPRIGGDRIDIKMVSECRWSWLSLMLLTLSCAVKQYRDSGFVSLQMFFMVLAHWLYSNATVKGEQYIPATWDMFHEKYGWMLNFWNITGVPFLYCFQSFFILRNQDRISDSFPHNLRLELPFRRGALGLAEANNVRGLLEVPVFSIALFVFLFAAYYMFDTANQQKAGIKISGNNKTLNERNCFPSFDWGVLKDPVFIHTPRGKLLVDGWYAFARKAQYTADFCMALSWGLATGFLSPMNYFYCGFFIAMISHRQMRDEERCQSKYGEHWTLYKTHVPNVFIPSRKFWSWWLFRGKHPFKETDDAELKRHLKRS